MNNCGKDDRKRIFDFVDMLLVPLMQVNSSYPMSFLFASLCFAEMISTD